MIQLLPLATVRACFRSAPFQSLGARECLGERLLRRLKGGCCESVRETQSLQGDARAHDGEAKPQGHAETAGAAPLMELPVTLWSAARGKSSRTVPPCA